MYIGIILTIRILIDNNDKQFMCIFDVILSMF